MKRNSGIRHDTYWCKIVENRVLKTKVFAYPYHNFFCECCVPKFRNQMYVTTRPYVRSGYDMWDDKTITFTSKVFTTYNRKEWCDNG